MNHCNSLEMPLRALLSSVVPSSRSPLKGRSQALWTPTQTSSKPFRTVLILVCLTFWTPNVPYMVCLEKQSSPSLLIGAIFERSLRKKNVWILFYDFESINGFKFKSPDSFHFLVLCIYKGNKEFVVYLRSKLIYDQQSQENFLSLSKKSSIKSF